MENTNRSAGEELAAKLLEEPKNAGLIMSDEEITAADGFCEDYKKFLNAAKTEREACAEAIKRATPLPTTKRAINFISATAKSR